MWDRPISTLANMFLEFLGNTKLLNVLTDIFYFPNLMQKNRVIGIFNRDGCGFVSILLKFACLYDVIAVDRYFSNITERLALQVI